jgi:hypothetical protein
MTFILAGTSYSATQATALVTSLLAADNAKALAKAAYQEAVQAEQKLLTTDGQVVRELRQNLVLIFSNSPTTLADLQVSLRKTPKPLTAAAQAAKEAKARATREARGTASKKQKATVTGDVTGVSITPTTTTGSAPPVTTPAAVATSPSVPAALPASVLAGTVNGTGTHS